MLTRILPDYPYIKGEATIDNNTMDIVAESFDAGIRHGGMIAPGMIAVPVGPDMRMAVLATPAYLDRHGWPRAAGPDGP